MSQDLYTAAAVVLAAVITGACQIAAAWIESRWGPPRRDSTAPPPALTPQPDPPRLVR